MDMNDDLSELLTNLGNKVEKLESHERITGVVLGLLIGAVLYIFFRG